MLVKNSLICAIVFSCVLLACNRSLATENSGFIRGGQFKDLILPMPVVDGLDTVGLWGGDNVLPREKDNGIEGPDWCYWGGNPIRESDGKYHIAICRWPEREGHNGWFDSEVAHCVSDSPLGPYKITRTIVEKGHNPEVLRLLDGTLALHTSDASVYSSQEMSGPWHRKGTIRIHSRGFRPDDRVGSNLTTELRPDGSVLIMKKDGDVAISRNGVLGPYHMVSAHNYSRATGYPEDPVIWRSRHQYHAIYNHAQDRRSAYMRSLDGIHWRNEGGLAYDSGSFVYDGGTKNEWHKFERPKIVQDEDGRATHLSLAVLDVSKGNDRGNDKHSSKNVILPLTVERRVSIVSDGPVTSGTSRITIRIESEDDFDPLQTVNVNSLRLGGAYAVNRGGGCTAVTAEPDGSDLLVYFEGLLELSHRDYDLKLLGETNAGELLFGYALLPDRTTTEASLITLPLSTTNIDGQLRLDSTIENWGLETSDACKLQVIRHDEEGDSVLHIVEVPSIEAYGSWPLSVRLNSSPTDRYEYRLVLLGDRYSDELWRYVDETESSVRFKGDWKSHNKSDHSFYMGDEKTSTQLGDEVTFSFTGTKARVFGRIGRSMGSFAVYLDGEYLETVRCNYAPVSCVKLYETEPLDPGPHNLCLVKVETEFNGEWSIDAFSYEESE